jgi:hypothetical protein
VAHIYVLLHDCSRSRPVELRVPPVAGVSDRPPARPIILQSNLATCAGLLQEMLKAARTGKASAEWKVQYFLELFMSCMQVSLPSSIGIVITS